MGAIKAPIITISYDLAIKYLNPYLIKNHI